MADVDDIQVQIDIIYKAIDKYNKSLEKEYPEEVLISIKDKLEKEQRKLNWFKKNHSEYFI